MVAPALTAHSNADTMADTMKTQVYITVDTECSMGGAWADAALRPVPPQRRIFCDIAGQSHGIGWLCDALLAHDFAATFFSEVFSAQVFGEPETRRWMGYLQERGQDVQLHTHLNFHYYARHLLAPLAPTERTDNLASLPPAQQRALLGEACSLFERLTGRRPTVFRAGNWVANTGLLQSLHEQGIGLDASFNACAQAAGSFPGEAAQINCLHQLGPLWEMPITLAHQTLPDPVLTRGLRPLDPTSMSHWELCKALNDGHALGMEHVSIVLHSFSLVKARDDQYHALRPDRVVQKRFKRLLAFLDANRDRFTVSTLAQLAGQLAENPPVVTPEPAHVPELGFFHPAARKLVQAVNRFT
jgi:hypothetical protein